MKSLLKEGRRISWICRIMIGVVWLGGMACPVRAVTLEDAIQKAMSAEEAHINTTQRDIQIQEAQKSVAFTRPQLELESRYLEMGTNAEEIPIAYLNPPDREFFVGLSLSQLIYAGDRIWNSLEYRDEIGRKAVLAFQAGNREITKRVTDVFLRALYQKAVMNILSDRLNQRRSELADAEDLSAAGVVTGLDVRQARQSLIFSQTEQITGQTRLEEALIDLNVVMGHSRKAPLPSPKGNLAEIPEFNKILGQLKALLKENAFLDIRRSENRVALARIENALARGRRLPEVRLMAAADSKGEAVDEMDESFRLGVQLDYPLLDGGARRASILSSGLALEQARHECHRIQKILAGAVTKLETQVRALERQIQLQQQAVDLSRENYEDARGQYRAGTITLTRFGEFNLAYAEARFNLLRIFYQRHQLLKEAKALLYVENHAN